MIRNKHILHGLDHSQYEHPFDRKALNALEKTPGLAAAGKWVNKNLIEKVVTVQYTGSNLRVTRDNYPRVHEYLEDAAVRAFIKMAGLPHKEYANLNTQSFLQQAEQFKDLDYGNMSKLIKFISILDDTHPWTVMRAAELLKWVNDGE